MNSPGDSSMMITNNVTQIDVVNFNHVSGTTIGDERVNITSTAVNVADKKQFHINKSRVSILSWFKLTIIN